MIVTHRLNITGTCPVDGTIDVYQCEVRVRGRVLKCEDIALAADELTEDGPVFQEDLTQKLSNRLRATVKTMGNHLQGRVTTTVVCRPEG